MSSWELDGRDSSEKTKDLGVDVASVLHKHGRELYGSLDAVPAALLSGQSCCWKTAILT